MDYMTVFLNTIIYANLIPFIILIIFLWVVHYNPIFDRRKERLFLIAGCINLIMLVVISINFISSKFVGKIFVIQISDIRKYTTLLNFMMSPVVPFLLYKINHGTNHSRKIYIPLFVNIGLCIISLFNGMIFSVDTSNHYGRGPLFFLPFICMLFYIICLIINIRNNHLKGKRYERTFLILVILLLTFGMYLEIGLHLSFMSWICAALIFPIYYLLLNINQSILDPLTGSFNRLMYVKELDKIEEKKSCVMALYDINNFKQVNDTLGHEVGDQYLIQLTNIMSNHLYNSAMLYRIGGDEFVIISEKESLEIIQDLILAAKKEANSYQIDFSYGIAYYDKKGSMNDFVQIIDQKMYANKHIDKAKN